MSLYFAFYLRLFLSFCLGFAIFIPSYVMLLAKHVLYSDVTWGIKKKLLRVVYLMALICDNTPLPSPILTGSQAIPIKLSKSK